jgi:class 3 adenylate cyclase/tetratricopeptide (TPR) repeat protein
MTCSGCGRANRDGARFCDGCGQRLEEPVALERGRDPRAYTPNHLAERILTSRAALEGERKQVSVLFADITGSMELAERVDPEAWHRILDGFFAVLAEGVHRFEGTINQFTGDGIMALFGAPIAHEDHAQRACFAALHLAGELGRYAREVKREHGLNFSVRMGINSGEVVVGRIGDDLRMDYTAQGQTVGLAARMQELASPDTCYLTERTAALVSGYFDLEDLGGFAVKGVREPVRVSQLRGPGALGTRFEVSRARGLTRFVGRDEDMRILETALGRAAQGDGQVVALVAEAGVGKSRLCWEFAERCRARGLRVLEGHAVPHGKQVSFLAMLQIIRAYFGITAEDSDRSAREKIAGRLLLLDEGFRETLPVMFDFLGVPDPERPAPPLDAEVRQHQLFGALRRLVRSAREPIVALVEDLHWLDAASEAFLEQWSAAIAGARGLLLVTTRPEYHAAWTQESHCHELPLAPLGREATSELLGDLLGEDPSLAGLVDTIHERSAGNPFFTEEIVRSLVESRQLEGTRGKYRLLAPVGKISVPETVQSILAARIDRLPERQKRILQAASVIGRRFSERILAAVANLPGTNFAETLRALQEAEFLYEQALYPLVEYAFKHPLTQEVAYGSQLTEHRRHIHAAVARAIEAASAEKPGERAALLAYHWESAGENLEAARWSRRAAEWAGSNDPDTAQRYWRKVRELLAAGPDTAEARALRIIACAQGLNLGFRLGIPKDDADRLFAEGRALAEREQNQRALAGLWYGYGIAKLNYGEVEGGCKDIAEGARLAEETTDEGLKLALRMGLALTTLIRGRFRETLEITATIVEHPPGDVRLGARIVGSSPYVGLLQMRSSALAYTGHPQEALAILDRTSEMSREGQELESVGQCQYTYVTVAYLTGDAQLAAGHARRVLETAEKLGQSRMTVLAHDALGTAGILAGQWRDAAQALETSLAIARRRRIRRDFEVSSLALLSEAYLGLGDVDRALAVAQEAVELARGRGTLFMETRAQVSRARALLRGEGDGARTEIETVLRRALALVEQTGARGYEPFVRVELAALARLTGDEAGWDRELRQAHALFTEMDAPIRAQQVIRELGL